MKHIQPDNMSRDFTKALSVMRVARNSFPELRSSTKTFTNLGKKTREMSKRKREIGCKQAIYNCWTFLQLSYKPGSYKMKFSFAFALALTGFFHNFSEGEGSKS